MVKATFTLDNVTVARLKSAAARLAKPQSEIIREAVRDYTERIGRLSERERQRMLEIIDRMLSQPPTRSQREVDREIREIRAARRRGGRRHPAS
jgi:Arc/MetJ-type ribon-helix-helix transcriptional regulator